MSFSESPWLPSSTDPRLHDFHANAAYELLFPTELTEAMEKTIKHLYQMLYRRAF